MNSRSISNEPAGSAPARPPRRRGQEAFTLVELLVVVAIIGILSAIALPQFEIARRAAAEQAVASQLRAMATAQQLFYPNPVPMRPSPLGDLTPRFATMNELNAFSNNAFGVTSERFYIEAPRVTYSTVPLRPSIESLRNQFVIQATEQGVRNGFIYQIDASGYLVKIR